MSYTRIADINPKQYLHFLYHPHRPPPSAWEDQVDRFSKGEEIGYLSPSVNEADVNLLLELSTSQQGFNAVTAAADKWRKHGGTWVGGTIKGVTSKIDRLKGLGEPRHEASQNSESVSSWLRHTKVVASDLEELNRTLCMASANQNGKPTIPFTHEACQAVT
jgi:hypothetical protein